MRPAFFAMFIALLLAGCMNRPPMTRDEYMALTTRQYPDISPEQLYKAAEAMFTFSDSNYRFAHSDGGMQAVDRGFGASVAWSLAVSKAGGGVRVQVGLTGPGAPGLAPVFMPGGAMGLAATSGGGAPATGTSNYDIFWARLEYMLGKRPDWMTCAEARERLIAGVVWGGPDVLCSSRLMDPKPDGPVVKPR